MKRARIVFALPFRKWRKTDSLHPWNPRGSGFCRTLRVAALGLLAGVLWAQQSSSVLVSSAVSGATFQVDGVVFTGPANFFWTAGSMHTLWAPSSVTGPDGSTQYTLTGWVDSNGNISTGTVETLFASSSVTSYQAVYTAGSYRVTVLLWGDTSQPDTTTGGACATPNGLSPGILRAGVAYVNGVCYWKNSILYISGGTLTLSATPYPGFTFLGWSVNGAAPSTGMTSYTVQGPVTLTAQFSLARRAQFRTTPPGLQVVIDHSTTATAAHSPCEMAELLPSSANIPLAPASPYPPMCYGDFDFAFGSQHILAAPTPQYDVTGKPWVFSAWPDGSGQNAFYTAPSSAGVDLLTATFAPGIAASFVTAPPGLKLTIDGRTNWPVYNFIWGTGSSHQIAAAAQQTDSSGRQYAFQSWSNGGDASQQVVANPDPVTGSLRLMATYQILGRLTIDSNPAGVAVQVDGAYCPTPCTLDRAPGVQTHISAPANSAASASQRLDFVSWADGGAASRTFTFTAAAQTITANYQQSFLLAASSNPAGGATFQFDPPTPDGFFPYGAPVSITATANSGYKFRRWTGDLSGTSASGYLQMNGSHSVVAQLDRVPYVAPTGVKNAAGDTPNAVVAPGSLIAITGENLAAAAVAGPASPLTQTIAGIVIQLGDRLLPLVSVAPKEIVAELPSDLEVGDYSLTVLLPGQPASTAQFTVARNAPGLFTVPSDAGTPVVMATHEDGTPVSLESPAKRNELVTLYGTGFGPTTPPSIDGFAVPDNPQFILTDPIELHTGDAVVQPEWSGAAPGLVGFMITRIRIADPLPTASAPQVSIRVNGQDSNVVVLPLE